MKKITSIVILALVSNLASAQSQSYRALKKKFRGHEDVYSINSPGFLTRTLLLIADEQGFKSAIKDVRYIRFTTIPKSAFKSEKVTVKGFIKFTGKDSFEELLHVHEGGDDITLLIQNTKKTNNNCYLLVVDSGSEVFVMEILGYINPKRLQREIKNANTRDRNHEI